MKKSVAGKIIRPILFCLIFCFLFSEVENVLANPNDKGWAIGTGLKLTHEYRDQYDVCALGPSDAIANLSHQELYERFGIAGVSVAAPEQDMYLTRYMFEEFLRYQKPKVVLLETRGFYRTDEDEINKAVNRADYIVHSTLDDIWSWDIKNRAIERVQQNNKAASWIEYFSRMYYAHSGWAALSEIQFRDLTDYEAMNGNVALFDVVEGYVNPDPNYDSGKEIKISERIKQDFQGIYDLCQEYGAELILLTSHIRYDRAYHRAVAEIAEEYQLTYLDLNDYIAETGFNCATDLNDYAHFNLSGAIKWTDFLGRYLTEHYDFPDRRGDERYSRYEDQREAFTVQKNYINSKVDLLSAVYFDDYLTVLGNLDLEDNLICISVYDEASFSLTENSSDLLKKLGLQTDIRGNYRSSYAAVIDRARVKEAFEPEKAVSLSGKSDEIAYTVMSGGFTSVANGAKASITINGAEYMQGGRGFNIVVYNKRFKSVVSSCAYDTCAYNTPVKSRLVAKSTSQYELAPNVWGETMP